MKNEPCSDKGDLGDGRWVPVDRVLWKGDLYDNRERLSKVPEMLRCRAGIQAHRVLFPF